MANCVWNIFTKNYQNLLIAFQATVENVGDTFLGHSVEAIGSLKPSPKIVMLTG